MPSNILQFDNAYRPDFEPQSWHAQEEVVKGLITSKDQIPKVAYSVEVEDYPLQDGYTISNKGCSKQIVARHPDGNIILGTCSPEYNPFGNDDIFNSVMEAFSSNNVPAKLVFALTMKNAQMVSFSFEIDGFSEFFAGGRPHKMYSCFSSSHNKTQGLKGFGTFTNVLCGNTHRAAMVGAKHGFDFTFWHDKKGKAAFSKLNELIDAVSLSSQLYSKLADEMAGKTINLNQAQAIAMQLLTQDSGKASTQIFHASEEIAHLFTKGIANDGNDLFDLFNAVTQFYTHGAGVGGEKVNPMKKLFSSEFGQASEKKELFLRSFQDKQGELISDAEINALAKNGEKLLLEFA